MRFLLLLIVFFITACSSNKVSKNHGFISLENKLENIVINKSNKNDTNIQKNIIQKPVIPKIVKVVDFQKKSEKENKIKIKYF